VHRPPTSDREVIVSATRRATGFRRAVAGACLIAAPLLFAAAELLFPQSSGDAGQQLATFAAHRTAETTAALLSVAMVLVFIPGLAGLVHLLRGRGRGWVWGLIGAAMMFFGLVTAHATLSGANLVFAEFARPGLDKTAMTALLDKILHDPVAFRCCSATKSSPLAWSCSAWACGEAASAPGGRRCVSPCFPSATSS
jgi:hypothetical protein